MRCPNLLFLVVVLALVIAWVPRLLGTSALATQPSLTPEEREVLSRTYRVLGKDDIPPIYHPSFVSATAAQLQPDELVLGVAINGETRAYPITILKGREMVNDTLRGVPILVTW